MRTKPAKRFFFDIERILKEKRPPAFMLKNVRNLTAHAKGKTFKVITSHLEALGYHVHAKVLNALDYGVPQNRERIIIAGFLENVEFTFLKPVALSERKALADILETDVDKKYYVRDSIKLYRLERLKDKGYPKPYIAREHGRFGNPASLLLGLACRERPQIMCLSMTNDGRPSANY